MRVIELEKVTDALALVDELVEAALAWEAAWTAENERIFGDEADVVAMYAEHQRLFEATRAIRAHEGSAS